MGLMMEILFTEYIFVIYPIYGKKLETFKSLFETHQVHSTLPSQD